MRIYRENFRPSTFLDEPYSLVSVGAIANDDPAEARRQSATTAMGMMRMFKQQGFSILHPKDVEDYPATFPERQFLDEWTDRTLHGTASEVAEGLEGLHEQTGVDELMLVTGGHSRAIHARTVELVADHYNLPNR